MWANWRIGIKIVACWVRPFLFSGYNTITAMHNSGIIRRKEPTSFFDIAECKLALIRLGSVKVD